MADPPHTNRRVDLQQFLRGSINVNLSYPAGRELVSMRKTTTTTNNETIVVATKRMSSNNDLDESFVPSEKDIICGWARRNFNHAGNKRLRDIIAANVQAYIAAQSKRSKGQIIADIVESVRRESPTGVGFVKMNPKTGRWSYLGTDKAKDKIGHALRKATQSLQQQGKKGKDAERKQAPQIASSLQSSNDSPPGGNGLHAPETDAVSSSTINSSPIHHDYAGFGNPFLPMHPAMHPAMHHGAYSRSTHIGQSAPQMELLRGPDPFADVNPDIPAAFLAVPSPQPHGYSPNRNTIYQPGMMPSPTSQGFDFYPGMPGQSSTPQQHLRLSPPGNNVGSLPPSSPLRCSDRPTLYPRPPPPSGQNSFLPNPFLMPEQDQRTNLWMSQTGPPQAAVPPSHDQAYYGYVPRPLFNATEQHGGAYATQDRDSPDSS